MPDELPPAVLLAAGYSRRFGADKRCLAGPGGAALAECAARPFVEAGLRLVVVLRHDDDPLAWQARLPQAGIVRVDAAARGLGDSLAAAAASLPDGSSILVGLADKPLLQAATVRAVLRALPGRTLVVPTYRGRPGHPVAFAGSLLARLRRLQGDEGARRLLCDPSVAAYRLATDDEGVCFDVDTPADVRRWRERARSAARTAPAGTQPP